MSDYYTEQWKKFKGLLKKGQAKKSLQVLNELVDNKFDYAMLEIGNIYESGIGDVEQDLKKALQWYEKALNSDLESEAEPLLRMARIYLYGPLNIEKDYDLAIKLYSSDCLSSSPVALLNLGLIYENGWGVDINFDRALEYYKTSAKEGNLYARVYSARVWRKNKNYLKAILIRLMASIFTLIEIVSDPDNFKEKTRRI